MTVDRLIAAVGGGIHQWLQADERPIAQCQMFKLVRSYFQAKVDMRTKISNAFC